MKSTLALVGILVLFSCGKEVDAIQPIKKSITESVYASGTVESLNQYTAFATASGIVNKIYLSEGDDVMNGGPILAITSAAQKLNKDNAELMAAFSDINANQGKLRTASQTIDLAKYKMQNDSLQWDRQKQLFAKNLNSKIELEQATLAYQNSKSNYSSAKINYSDLKRQLDMSSKQAKNNLQIAKTSQNDFTLSSSITGKVYAVNVEVGEIVTPQSPLAVLGASNDFILKMQVDEYDINQIQKGQKVIVTLDTDRKKSYEAVISKIYPMMNLQSKTFLVEATFVTRPTKLYPNVSFEANIVIQTKDNALLIPRECLIDDSYVLNKKGDKLKVKTGLMDYNYVEILSGLKENESIQKPEK